MTNLFLFDHCCGCIDLKIGCLVIGYFQLTVEIIYSIIITCSFALGGMVAVSDNESLREEGVVVFLVIMAIFFVVILLLLAFTITLLVGLHNHKRGHIKAYLVFAWIMVMIGFLGMFRILRNPVPVTDIIIQIASQIIFIYFSLVINSYYKKMDDNLNKLEPPPYKA